MNEKGRTVEGDRIAKKHTRRLGENPALRNAPLLTKLMTAMVVLDAESDMEELITVEDPSFRTNLQSRTRLTDGGSLPRRTVLELALMSSDNHATAPAVRFRQLASPRRGLSYEVAQFRKLLKFRHA